MSRHHSAGSRAPSKNRHLLQAGGFRCAWFQRRNLTATERHLTDEARLSGGELSAQDGNKTGKGLAPGYYIYRMYRNVPDQVASNRMDRTRRYYSPGGDRCIYSVGIPEKA